MPVQLTCIVVDANSSNLKELSGFLAARGVEVIQQLRSVNELISVLGGQQPQLAVVNLDPSPQENLRRVGQLARQYPSVSFIVLSELIDAQLLMEAMQLGVREFIPLPVQEDKLAASLDRVVNIHGMAKRARVIHVVPTAGGCGATTISCNIATTLAKKGKTVLLDLDLAGGTVASAFDLRPRYTISDVIESADKLDRHLLENALTVHAPSNLAVLARPDLPEDSARVQGSRLSRLLDGLSRVFDYVVLDSVLSVNDPHLVALRAADINVVVTQLNVPSTRNAERLLSSFRRLGIDPAKVKLVVNRFVKKGCDVEPQEVERVLGAKIDWMVPNDFRTTIDAINFGLPAVLRAPRAPISSSMRELAHMLNGRSGD